MKAVVIYNDFDRDYYKSVVAVAGLLTKQATHLNGMVRNEWCRKDLEKGRDRSIQRDINNFLDRFLKDTSEDYLIKELEPTQITKAMGYLVFIKKEYKRRLDEKTPIDIIKV